ncbi:hypothetical protein M433DRAFT_512242 [Acidomyces richmondensis BFW]|nr:MAG: hypothetical protein FE78DRAFT_319094 [Acidomyces sp. 'richmondensis']KYG47143.1 hypothetical protein M433DRAFT_512242 [Acidomyces richmondensis BFW]
MACICRPACFAKWILAIKLRLRSIIWGCIFCTVLTDYSPFRDKELQSRGGRTDSSLHFEKRLIDQLICPRKSRSAFVRTVHRR